MRKFYKGFVIFMWLAFVFELILAIIGSPLIKQPEMLVYTFFFNLMNTGFAWVEENN